MTLHANLTGSDLHEPKGADTASSGDVYEFDGAGSGSLVQRLDGIHNLNSFVLNGVINDSTATSTAEGRTYVYVADKSELTAVAVVLRSALDTVAAAEELDVYVNGVNSGTSVTIPATTAALTSVTTAFGSPIAISEGSFVELRTTNTNTASPAASFEVFFIFTAVE